MISTKDRVLGLLLAGEGSVSGEEMSRKLRVSRMAVNNAVQTLRAEGYDIASATRTGYRLEKSPDRLCPGEMLYRLGAKRMERVEVLESVDSTNTWLKHRALELPHGTVCLARGQTGGRGRMGRRFFSPANRGVYLSVLMKPDCSPADTVGITAMAAVEACRAVEAVSGRRPGIKWVNDLELEGRKLGGILTELGVEAESGRIQYLIVGVGINVSGRVFPLEIDGKAVSLAQAGVRDLSRCDLAGELIRRLDALSEGFLTRREEYREEYRARCTTLGRDLSFLRDGERIAARAEDIDERFGLVVSTPEGRQILRTGEVRILPPPEKDPEEDGEQEQKEGD